MLIITALSNYAETQEKLIVEFQKQYHPLFSDINLLEQPKTGILLAMGEEWRGSRSKLQEQKYYETERELLR